MTALALLSRDLLGTGTQFFGCICSQTTVASLAVQMGAGRVYTMAPLEPSTWSSLAADATSVLKQGITFGGQIFNTPVPGTTGQSINYLIQAQYQENDIDNAVLSYYNASNPQQPFSGAGNLGISQPTTRASQLVYQIKAGLPATTGTQATPAPDAGWTSLWAVTVAFGQTTVVGANIALVAGAPISQANSSGQFTLTGTGFSGTAPTAVAGYRITNGIATIAIGPGMSGTSNATSFTMTGLPSFLQPNLFAQNAAAAIQLPIAVGTDNSASVNGVYATVVPGSGTINLFLAHSLTGWTGSGTKAVSGCVSYPI